MKPIDSTVVQSSGQSGQVSAAAGSKAAAGKSSELVKEFSSTLEKILFKLSADDQVLQNAFTDSQIRVELKKREKPAEAPKREAPDAKELPAEEIVAKEPAPTKEPKEIEKAEPKEVEEKPEVVAEEEVVEREAGETEETEEEVVAQEEEAVEEEIVAAESEAVVVDVENGESKEVEKEVVEGAEIRVQNEKVEKDSKDGKEVVEFEQQLSAETEKEKPRERSDKAVQQQQIREIINQEQEIDTKSTDVEFKPRVATAEETEMLRKVLENSEKGGSESEKNLADSLVARLLNQSSLESQLEVLSNQPQDTANSGARDALLAAMLLKHTAEVPTAGKAEGVFEVKAASIQGLGKSAEKKEGQGAGAESKEAQQSKSLPKNQASRTMERVQDALKEIIKAKEGKTVSLRLDPPSLGTVKVDVTLKDGGVHARLVAESQSVSTLLRERAFELQGMLRRLGLNFDEVTVSVSSGYSNTGEETSGGKDANEGGEGQLNDFGFGENGDGDAIAAERTETQNESDAWVA